jgi:Fe-S cluster assembly protein SufD
LNEEWSKRGVSALSLDEADPDSIPRLTEILCRGLDEADNRFQAWHYNQLSHGVYLYVPGFVEVDTPILLDFVEGEIDGERGDGTGLQEGAPKGLSSPHVVVVLDRGARATVIQRTYSADGAELLCNAGLDLYVSQAADLSYFHLQNLNERSLYFNHGTVSVAQDARLEHLDALIGGRLLKSRLECALNGRGSDADLNGLYFARERQHMDIRTVQRHRSDHADSRAFYKGAVRDGARTIYQGLIDVSPHAAKTDAYLTNKNLILNDGARADSIPSLKIDTNDVKCSHGSTTGRIDEQEAFYLMSRGYSKTEAETMLIQGYFEELLSDTPAVFGDEVRRLIQARASFQRASFQRTSHKRTSIGESG